MVASLGGPGVFALQAGVREHQQLRCDRDVERLPHRKQVAGARIRCEPGVARRQFSAEPRDAVLGRAIGVADGGVLVEGPRKRGWRLSVD
jgi:hypothetical protein